MRHPLLLGLVALAAAPTAAQVAVFPSLIERTDVKGWTIVKALGLDGLPSCAMKYTDPGDHSAIGFTASGGDGHRFVVYEPGSRMVPNGRTAISFQVDAGRTFGWSGNAIGSTILPALIPPADTEAAYDATRHGHTLVLVINGRRYVHPLRDIGAAMEVFAECYRSLAGQAR